ncbi:WxL domain-containing protein [Enterococcus quebecensis]|uniref:WxL domain-containing protein n=1 Tax=Enterococcus quebecensis TaxID=903983 RepID=A0A1E5GS71_9ENTE|nr:WxL domain-containing protein [Enterococcus quebecensis]OEG15553.1 hypothetical protein BCR23_08800 [Enterococcus quebecensis]
MKRYIESLLLLFLTVSLSPAISFAEEVNGTRGTGTIQFEKGSGDDHVIYDPEQPEVAVDPGESPKTTGALRIDFVPTLNFSANSIKKGKNSSVFSANAQLFHGETPPRGSFIQISDYRGNAGGWTLQMRQETQFSNNETLNNTLNGAVISFDKSWASSAWPNTDVPNVQKDVIKIENIGDTYNLAEAQKNTGEGSWAIVFGASQDNPKSMASTLKPKVDKQGNPVTDQVFENKPIHENSAISIEIPNETKIDPVTYQTEITWILSELP